MGFFSARLSETISARFARGFQGLSISLQRAFRFSERRPALVLVAFAVLTAMAGTGIPKLRTLLAMEDLLNVDAPSRANLQELVREFRIRNSMRALIPRPETGWRREDLRILSEWQEHTRIRNPDLLSITSVFDLRHTVSTDHSLTYPNVIDVAGVPDGVRSPKDPDLARSLALAARGPWKNILIASDASSLTLAFELADSTDRKYGSFDPRAIESIHRAFETEVTARAPGLRPFWIGAADFQHHLYIGLKRVSLLNFVLLGLLIVLLRVFLGTWKSGAIFVSTIVLAGTLLYGLMGLAGAPIDILSKSLFLMTAVAALEDFHFLSALQMQGHGNPGRARNWRKTFRDMITPGFLTSFTTALGFISLHASGLEIIRRFGLWAAVGSGLEWFILFFGLPAVAHYWPALRQWVDPSRVRGNWRRLEDARPPRHAAPIVILTYVLAVTTFPLLNVQDFPTGMFPEDHPLRRGLAFLRDKSGWETEVSLVFPAGTDRTLAEATASVVARHPIVADIESPFAILDSFTASIAPDDSARRALIESEVRRAPFMRSFFGHGADFRYGVLLRENDTRSLRNFTTVTERICATVGCRVAGSSIVYAEFSSAVPATLLESLGLSLLLVGFALGALTFAVGRIDLLARILLSSFWGVGLMFVGIALFRIRVNFLTCVFASVLVGLTGDNAIFFLLGSRRKNFGHGLDKFGGASLKCGVTMAIASLVFLGSYFVPPRIFGLLLASGFLASLYGDFYLLKGLTLPKEKPNP